MTTISSLDLREVAGRYGKALLELAVEQNQLEVIQTEATTMIQLLEQVPELQDVVSSPLYSKEDQESMIASVAKQLKMSDLFYKFILSLCENRRMMVLHGALEAFLELVLAYQNIKKVQIYVARPLEAKQQDALIKTLEQELGQKVQIHTIIDPSLKGGISIEIDSLMIDNTIQSKLNRYQQAMKGII